MNRFKKELTAQGAFGFVKGYILITKNVEMVTRNYHNQSTHEDEPALC